MKKILIVIIITIFSFNCFSVTIFLKDNNQLSGEIKKIDKQKIFLSTTYLEKLFIINKSDIKSISGIRSFTEGEIDLTEEILNCEPYGKVNYNSFKDVIDIELVGSENPESIDYTAIETEIIEPPKRSEDSDFDDNREGFIIGFGIGGHLSSFIQKIEYVEEVYRSSKLTKRGLATDFRIGYAPKHNLEIFYVSKIAWFSISNMNEQIVIISDGIGALGISYFFDIKTYSEKWKKLPFISIGFGYSSWRTPFEKNSASSFGIGLFTAIGYEINKHSRIELSYFVNNPAGEIDSVKLKTNSDALMILFNYMWY